MKRMAYLVITFVLLTAAMILSTGCKQQQQQQPNPVSVLPTPTVPSATPAPATCEASPIYKCQGAISGCDSFATVQGILDSAKATGESGQGLGDVAITLDGSLIKGGFGPAFSCWSLNAQKSKVMFEPMSLSSMKMKFKLK